MTDWGAKALQECVDLVSVHDSYGNYLFASESFARFLGYTPEELLGTPAYAYFHTDDVEAIGTSHEKSLYEGQPNVVVYRLQRKDGGYEWVETTSRTVLEDPDGRGTIYTVTRPITWRAPERASFAWLPDPRHAYEV